MNVSATWMHFKRNFAGAFGGQQIIEFPEDEV
jgi:hypothetical protein